MNTNSLIDFNLKLLNNNLDIRALELKDEQNEFLEKEISLALFKKMLEEKLIFTDQYNALKLSTKGHEILEIGGWLKHVENEKIKSDFLADKEILEFKKSKIDLELSKKVLKEYPYTKWFARIGFAIAIILAVLEIIQWKNK